MNWNNYFEMMIDWKKLPAYRAEPRIDSLIGFYLPSILADQLKDGIEGVIPEFPLRLGTLKPNHEKKNYSDLSYKVDFLVIGTNGVNYLVEFKTDTNSLRDPQNKYLDEAKQSGTGALVDGVIKISAKSSYKTKYNYLKQKMQELGMLDESFKYTGKNPNLEIVYILPSNKHKEKNKIGFDEIASWFEKEFTDPDSFERAFSEALRKWGND